MLEVGTKEENSVQNFSFSSKPEADLQTGTGQNFPAQSQQTLHFRRLPPDYPPEETAGDFRMAKFAESLMRQRQLRDQEQQLDQQLREQEQQQLERQLRDRQETRSRYLLSFSYFLPFKLNTQSSIIHVVKV